ncbi:MAG TPA: ABC transporter permease [Bryobacteraceae bacterium]|nr:ABC transporter permease [Bryobacteraceae bacterium]
MKFWRRKKENDLDRELQAHLDLEAEEQREAGLLPLEARYAAQRALGNTTLVKERTRDMWGFILLGQFWQDLKYAVRGLRRTPGFAVVALLSLGLGIGATTALFSVVYGVLIAPYPYAKPGEIWAPAVVGPKETPKYPHFYPPREFVEIQKLPAFSSGMATALESVLMTGDHAPESFGGVFMSGNGFNFLAVKPVIGRTIQPFDIGPGGEPAPVVVLSYRLWQRLFDGRESALGQKLVLNNVPHTIIGVMPPRFGWFTSDGFWLPLSMDPKEESYLNVIMRLAPGVTKQIAEEQLQALNQQFARVAPQNFPKGDFRTVFLNYMDITVASGEMKSSLNMLLAAVGFLLLIACVNVANLQLARTTTRAREIALRLSIGANRGRLVRQLLTESVLLSMLGGIFGVLLAIGITKAIAALIPEFYVPNEARITVNGWVLLFSFIISVLTGILFGLVPALECSRPNLVDSLKEGSRGAGGSVRGQKTRRTLVVVEVALAVILLAASSLTIRNFEALLNINPGFHPERTLMVDVQLSPKQYSTIEQRNIFAQTLLERVKNLPGVLSATIGNGGMPWGGPRSSFSIEGLPSTEAQRLTVGLISADYAQTFGVSLRRGRQLTDQDVMRGDHFALINETAAKLWPVGQDPIGKHVTLDLLTKPGGRQVLVPSAGAADVTVVGILADTRNAGLRDATTPGIYVPYTLLAPPGRVLAVRTAGEPMTMLNTLRTVVQQMDREVPLARPITVQEVLGFETVQPRFNMALFGAFAALGLALAAAGIYSVISYDVTQRIHEIGVRLALGASRADVLGMVLRMAGSVVAIGLAIGIAGSIALVRLVRFEVFQGTAFDPLSVLMVVAVLSSVALIASSLPAYRAARLDPVTALRHD